MFTQALIIEMPYDLFWYGETDLFYNYLDAYVKKQNLEEYRDLIKKLGIRG